MHPLIQKNTFILVAYISLLLSFSYGEKFYNSPLPDLPAAQRIISVRSNTELNSAINNAQAGDRIVLADGSYNGIKLTGLKGSAENPIVFVAENERQAWISGSTSGRNAYLSDCAHLEFRGLRFTGAQVWGLTMGPAYSTDSNSLGCNHIRIINCEIDHAGQLLLKVNGMSYNIEIIGNSLHHSGMSGSGKPYAEGIYLGDGGLMTDRSHDILVQGNHLYNIGNSNNWGEAIDIKIKTYNITVVDNLIENVIVNSQGAITALVNDLDYPAGMTDPNILIARNVIHNVRRRSGGYNGAGISAGSNGIRIYNNLIWDCDESSITATRNASNTTGAFTLYNNTLWDGVLINQSSIGSANSPVDPVLANNLIRGSGATGADRIASSSDFIGPLDGSAIAVTYTGSGFQLSSNSGAVGSGIALSNFNDDLTTALRPASGYSYGAFEALAVDSPPPATGSGEVIYAINCGGSAHLASDGVRYQADGFYLGGSTATRSSAIDATSDDPLYQSERYGPFQYSLPVENGSYLLTLMYSETYWTAPGQRIFDSFAEAHPVIAQLDILARVGMNRALNLQLPVEVRDGALDLSFIASADKPKLSALRLETLPTPTVSDETPEALLRAALKIESSSASERQSKLPRTQVVNLGGENFLELIYRRLIGGAGDAAGAGYLADGILYQVEWSTDLENWNHGSLPLEGTSSAIDNGDGTETHRVRNRLKLQNTPKLFMRLKLSRI